MQVRLVGRYALFGEIASGGMASVYFGRLLGPVGFSRTVAIKRLHPHFARDPEFVTMFLEEARLAARIRHPNVVSTLDVVAAKGELFLVMDYVQGESLAKLERTLFESGARVPLSICRAVMVNVLHGLHAAHEAKNERGDPLGIVHRDISPQNILVGVDGIARVFDFGIAKAAGRAQVTREGYVKGKLAYMSPEQYQRRGVDRRADVYAASVVLWELLTGKRLFQADTDAIMVARILTEDVAPPSTHTPEIPKELDAVVLRGLCRDPSERFATARDMARALESSGPLAPPSEVGEWVETTAQGVLALRTQHVAELEQLSDFPAHSASSVPPEADLITPMLDRHNIPTAVAPVEVSGQPVDEIVLRTIPAEPFSVLRLLQGWWERSKADRRTLVMLGSSAVVLVGLFWLLTPSSPARATQDLPLATSAGSPVSARIPSAAGVAVTSASPIGVGVAASAVGVAASGGNSSAVGVAASGGNSSAVGVVAPAGSPYDSGLSPSAATPTTFPGSPISNALGSDSASPQATGSVDTEGAVAEESPPPLASVSSARKPSRPAPKLGSRLPGSRADCQTPYTVDAVGHRHYKRECL